jgi:hypothetical protein
MVKNRKPLFVSEKALRELQRLAREKKCFAGDVVDMLVGVKTEEELNEEFIQQNDFARRVGRAPTKAQLARGDSVLDSGGVTNVGDN